MQGFIPVDIPTKTYIKAYVHSKLGPTPLMTTDGDNIAHKMYDLLQHTNNERADQFENKMYKTKMRVYIPKRTYHKRGAFLNATNVKNFNLYIEKEIKNQFYMLMDIYMDWFPCFINNLPEVRRKLGIDIEAWVDDSMKKDYYRYRLREKEKQKVA